MKGQRFIFITFCIYILAGVAALLYLPSHTIDTVVKATSITTAGVMEPSDPPAAADINTDLPPDAPPSNDPADTVSTPLSEEPLFVDIKGTPVYQSKYYTYTACHTEGNLFLRVSPGITEKILSRLSPGDTNIVITPAEEWSYVQHKNLTGYVSNQFLAFTEREPTEEELLGTENPDTVSANTPETTSENSDTFTVKSDVTLRSEGSKNSKALGALKAGESGRILSYGKTWSHVECGNLKGYVSTRYLNIQ